MVNIQEVWKPIKDYEGFYEVSNLGRVKRLATTQPSRNKWNSFILHRKERIHKYHINNNGRPRIELSKNGVQQIFSVGRLVAAAFIPNQNNLPCVCHKDDDPLNNKVENLFWGTHADNIADKVRKNRQAKGEKNGRSYLKEYQVIEIRSKFATGTHDIKLLSNEYNTTYQNISHIVTRKNWKYL